MDGAGQSESEIADPTTHYFKYVLRYKDFRYLSVFGQTRKFPPLSITGQAELDEHSTRTVRVGINGAYNAEDGTGRVFHGPGDVCHVFQTNG